MADTYSVNQLLDKTIVARTAVPLYRDISNYYKGLKGVYTVQPGQIVGVLYGSLIKNGSDLWFQFYDSAQRPYWALYKSGILDANSLKQQGAKSDTQVQQQAQESQKSTSDKIIDAFKSVGTAGAIGLAVAAIIFLGGNK